MPVQRLLGDPGDVREDEWSSRLSGSALRLEDARRSRLAGTYDGKTRGLLRDASTSLLRHNNHHTVEVGMCSYKDPRAGDRCASRARSAARHGPLNPAIAQEVGFNFKFPLTNSRPRLDRWAQLARMDDFIDDRGAPAGGLLCESDEGIPALRFPPIRRRAVT